MGQCSVQFKQDLEGCIEILYGVYSTWDAKKKKKKRKENGMSVGQSSWPELEQSWDGGGGLEAVSAEYIQLTAAVDESPGHVLFNLFFVSSIHAIVWFVCDSHPHSLWDSHIYLFSFLTTFSHIHVFLFCLGLFGLHQSSLDGCGAWTGHGSVAG
jgi:hypothetical protein